MKQKTTDQRRTDECVCKDGGGLIVSGGDGLTDEGGIAECWRFNPRIMTAPTGSHRTGDAQILFIFCRPFVFIFPHSVFRQIRYVPLVLTSRLHACFSDMFQLRLVVCIWLPGEWVSFGSFHSVNARFVTLIERKKPG